MRWPRYDAFGRPLTGEASIVAPEEARRAPRAAIGAVMVVALALGGAVLALGGLNLPAGALVSLGLLDDDGPTWFATFKGYHGDVRGKPDGTVPGAHKYP